MEKLEIESLSHLNFQTGVYICVASNIHGQVERDFQLNILGVRLGFRCTVSFHKVDPFNYSNCRHIQV